MNYNLAMAKRRDKHSDRSGHVDHGALNNEHDPAHFSKPTGKLTNFPDSHRSERPDQPMRPLDPLGDALTRSRHGRSGKKNRKGKSLKAHRPNFIARGINHWFNRLLGAASRGSFAGQEGLYAAHQTTRDYAWNAIGIASWGMVFPLLTIVATQIIGVEQAGMFSMAFVVGTLLMFLGNYGVRTYQVSDLEENHSFSDYQVNRWFTCIVMLVVGFLYCMLRGYASDMFAISMGVYVYKMIDALADVYEGRLQQVDKLYLAGISQSIRSLLVLVVFAITLVVSHNLVAACIAMAIVAAASFVFVTFPLAHMETPKSRKLSIVSLRKLFAQCFPLFVALFMYSLIDNMPKFIMEGALSYDNQLYFNAIYFPAMIIILVVGFIYKPQLVRIANIWADPKRHRLFDLIIFAVVVVVIILVVLMILLMQWVGIPAMNFLYGIDFEPFRDMFSIMLVAGGVAAIVDFLYQIITVLRKQKAVMALYVIAFGFSLLICILLVNYTGLNGAIVGYLIVMSILLVLLIMEFFRIRRGFSEEEAQAAAEEASKQRKRALNIPAIEDSTRDATRRRQGAHDQDEYVHPRHLDDNTPH